LCKLKVKHPTGRPRTGIASPAKSGTSKTGHLVQREWESEDADYKRKEKDQKEKD